MCAMVNLQDYSSNFSFWQQWVNYKRKRMDVHRCACIELLNLPSLSIYLAIVWHWLWKWSFIHVHINGERGNNPSFLLSCIYTVLLQLINRSSKPNPTAQILDGVWDFKSWLELFLSSSTQSTFALNLQSDEQKCTIEGLLECHGNPIIQRILETS